MHDNLINAHNKALFTQYDGQQVKIIQDDTGEKHLCRLRCEVYTFQGEDRIIFGVLFDRDTAPPHIEIPADKEAMMVICYPSSIELLDGIKFDTLVEYTGGNTLMSEGNRQFTKMVADMLDRVTLDEEETEDKT